MFKTITRTVVPAPYEETVHTCEVCGHETWEEEDALRHQLEHVVFIRQPGASAGCSELIYCPVDDEKIFTEKLRTLGYSERYISIFWTGPGWYGTVRDVWDSETYDVLSTKALVQQLQKQVESIQKQIAELEAINQGEVK